MRLSIYVSSNMSQVASLKIDITQSTPPFVTHDFIDLIIEASYDKFSFLFSTNELLYHL